MVRIAVAAFLAFAATTLAIPQAPVRPGGMTNSTGNPGAGAGGAAGLPDTWQQEIKKLEDLKTTAAPDMAKIYQSQIDIIKAGPGGQGGQGGPSTNGTAGASRRR